MLTIVQANSPHDIDEARRLFNEYAASLNFSLCFQGFEQELAGLPGAYAPPTGRLLLAFDGQHAVGCVGLRKFGESVAELKRLYIDPAHRGEGVGRRLALAAIQGAREAGYASVRLDTAPSMIAAIALYRSLEFKEISTYRQNPIAGSLFMELRLNADTPSP